MKTILQTIGNTPLVRLENLELPRDVQILAKLEGTNPGGSIKDRAALGMIEGAEKRGDLNQDTVLLEPTSGNTGIALAMIARLKGYALELVMPGNASQERIDTMEAFGATVTLTPAIEGMEGAIDLAQNKHKAGGYYLLNQFGNPDNPDAHYSSTGPELWQQTRGAITHFVSAMGTTGTIMGVSRYLKEQNPEIEVVGVQPDETAHILGIRRWPKAYLPAIFEPDRVDHIIDVSEAESHQATLDLALQEGIFSGISAGGALAASLQLATKLQSGTIVFIVPDRGDRYLSTGLFKKEKT